MKLFPFTAGTAAPCRTRCAGFSLWRMLGLAYVLFAAAPAQSLVIELHEVGTTPLTAAQLAAFQTAARLWEGRFSDPITVIVNIGFSALRCDPDFCILAQSGPVVTTHQYADVRAALIANAESVRERDTMSDLPVDSVPVRDIIDAHEDDEITMTTANAKALGLGTGPDPIYGAALPNDADASIVFNSVLADQFDYDRSDGIGAGRQDFVAVAAHEIGHALGFMSVTDTQDENPARALHPSTLDLWRFEEREAHFLDSSERFVTHGPAEYYDGVWLTLPFSRGVMEYDDHCQCCDGYCQASHWRDNWANQLMDPTGDRGVIRNIHSDDMHALSYIGYEISENSLGRRDLPGLQHALLKWFCLTCPARIPPHWTDPWPGVPGSPLPNSSANLAFVIGLEMTLPGERVSRLRSGIGYARFQPARPNSFPTLPPPRVISDQVIQSPIRPPATTLPPALMEFYFVSDRSNGVPFTARALFSTAGAQFNRSLGPFGGYRITLAIDGEGDGVIGDMDGLMTMVLLADARGVPDSAAQNEFQLAPNFPDNGIQVVDALALGLLDVGAPRAEIEPNNLPATANNLGAPSFVTVLGAISPVNDVDYYRFNAPTNSKAWITVDTGGAMQPGANSRDCLVTLYDANFVILETDDNDGSGNGGNVTLETGLASAIAGRTLVAGGTYYIRVSAAVANVVIDPYRLFLTITVGAIPAEVEANNTAATANLLLPAGAISGVRSGRIATSTDVDYFAVIIPVRSILHISADGNPERDGIGTDVLVDLLAPNGALLFSANSSAAGVAANPPAEGYCFVTGPGVYRVRVRSASSVTGTYNLMVSACPLPLPRLLMERDGQAARLSWPADAVGFTLQSSSDTRQWSNVTLEQKWEADRIIVELPSGLSTRFFRLMSPE